MLTSFKRVVKIGVKSFLRNPTLSIASIFVMTMVVSLITALFIFNASANVLITNIQDKVDISVYFNENAPTENILGLKARIASMPEVGQVEYISKEQALQIFSERHKDDPLIIESLNQVGGNPFLDSLSIKTKQASQYEQVANFLQSAAEDNNVNKIDYFERKSMIENAFGIIYGVRGSVIGFSILLGLIAIFIAFNTVKIAIFNSKEEISVMKLVGASNWFVRGPFLVEGIIIGTISGLLVFLFTFALCYGLNDKIKDFAPIISTFNIFVSNIWIILLIQIASGVALGILSSFAAMRRYLKV